MSSDAHAVYAIDDFKMLSVRGLANCRRNKPVACVTDAARRSTCLRDDCIKRFPKHFRNLTLWTVKLHDVRGKFAHTLCWRWNSNNSVLTLAHMSSNSWADEQQSSLLRISSWRHLLAFLWCSWTLLRNCWFWDDFVTAMAQCCAKEQFSCLS